MNQTFTASRISEKNVLFPTTIIFTDEGVIVKMPALLISTGGAGNKTNNGRQKAFVFGQRMVKYRHH